MSLSFSGNTLTSTVRNAVVSMTQLQATLSQTFNAAQYLHHATFLIADSDHLFQNLTTIDHPLTDRYVGLPCELDMTAEPLTNTLVINTLIPAKKLGRGTAPKEHKSQQAGTAQKKRYGLGNCLRNRAARVRQKNGLIAASRWRSRGARRGTDAHQIAGTGECARSHGSGLLRGIQGDQET